MRPSQLRRRRDDVDLIRSAYRLRYACVLLTLLALSLVATATVMSVQDRVQEREVLPTLGMRPVGICAVILSESLITRLTCGAIGVVAAMLRLTFRGLALEAEGVALAFQPTQSLGISDVAAWIVVSLAGGVLLAAHAPQANIVTA